LINERLCISSLESGVRITTDCLITHFFTDALESISRSTQFDENINLAMVLSVCVRMGDQMNFCESGIRFKG